VIEIDSKALVEAMEAAEREVRRKRRNRRRPTYLQSLHHSLQTIAGRLGFASIALTVMLVLLGLILSLAFRELTSRHEQARVLAGSTLAAAELTANIADSRYNVARYAATGDRSEVERGRAALAGARQRLAAIRALAFDTNPATAEAIAQLQVQLESFERQLPTANGEALDASGKRLSDSAREVEGRLAALSAEDAAELTRLNKILSVFASCLIVLVTLIAVAGARFLSRDISGSLGKITVAMTGLAAGNRRIVIPGGERSDEIGEMARALAVFRESAEQLAGLQEEAARMAQLELRRNEEAHDAQARLMHELAAKFERTVGEVVGSVAAASSQLQDTATAMAAAAGRASGSASEVVESMEHTASGVTAAAAASDQFAFSVGEISRQATNSADLARTARISAEEADVTIAELNRATGQVGAIVQLIGSIAERTNLLALNASIEAARGGEAGRGFAVVAAEVKELASRTRRATDEVSSHIAGIEQTTRASVAALRKIEQQIRQVESNASTIAQAVDAQTVASQQLAHNLDQAASGTTAVRTSVGQVREMALTTGSAASQVLAAAGGAARPGHRVALPGRGLPRLRASGTSVNLTGRWVNLESPEPARCLCIVSCSPCR
jgi:methyl-accepting chemotaxis protein